MADIDFEGEKCLEKCEGLIVNVVKGSDQPLEKAGYTVSQFSYFKKDLYDLRGRTSNIESK